MTLDKNPSDAHGGATEEEFYTEKKKNLSMKITQRFKQPDENSKWEILTYSIHPWWSSLLHTLPKTSLRFLYRDISISGLEFQEGHLTAFSLYLNFARLIFNFID